MPYVYFLQSEKDHGWYIGQTTLDPEKRLVMHNAGRVRSTKPRRPFRLAYVELHDTRQSAMKREWHLKHPAGYLEKLRIIEVAQSQRDLFEIGPKGPFGPRAHAWGA